MRIVAARVKLKEAASTSGAESAESGAAAAAMSKLTTFSLELSEEEKRARSKVVMPFWKEEQKAAAAAGRVPYIQSLPSPWIPRFCGKFIVQVIYGGQKLLSHCRGKNRSESKSAMV